MTAPAGRQAAHWSALADPLAASLTDAVHATGRWQRSPEDGRVDAAPAAGDPRLPAGR